ncbi:MAG: hypothetical protein CEN87_702 [Parcubacteria group bacterium Licking1014_1]|nr:MAG: hypothetical protein CEN87_702 [Parcubacteria group bacterium Licking1014_1]
MRFSAIFLFYKQRQKLPFKRIYIYDIPVFFKFAFFNLFFAQTKIHQLLQFPNGKFVFIASQFFSVEPILLKISDDILPAPPAGGAGRNKTEKSARAQKFSLGGLPA